MRLLILAQQKHAYTSRRLIEAARKAKHKAEAMTPTKFRLGFGDVAFVDESGGQADFDVVLPRFASSLQTYGSAVLSQLEATGVRAFNTATSVTLVRNRIRCLQALVGASLPVPNAALIRRPDDVDAAIEAVGGLPVMLRRVSGPPTFGGLFCETRQGALAALEALWGLGHEVLLSQHFSELNAEGLRCLVLDGEVVATIRRKGRTTRTRFRFDRRGKTVEVSTPRQLAELLCRVCDITGLRLAGIDVVETQNGYRILEVNAVPGIEQLEATTGRDLAKLIVEAMARFAAPHVERRLKTKSRAPRVS